MREAPEILCQAKERWTRVAFSNGCKIYLIQSERFDLKELLPQHQWYCFFKRLNHFLFIWGVDQLLRWLKRICSRCKSCNKNKTKTKTSQEVKMSDDEGVPGESLSNTTVSVNLIWVRSSLIIWYQIHHLTFFQRIAIFIWPSLTFFLLRIRFCSDGPSWWSSYSLSLFFLSSHSVWQHWSKYLFSVLSFLFIWRKEENVVCQLLRWKFEAFKSRSLEGKNWQESPIEIL